MHLNLEVEQAGNAVYSLWHNLIHLIKECFYESGEHAYVEKSGGQFLGTPKTVTHCHCSMCRKAHGAAFGTYIDTPHNDFQWLGELETLKKFKSSSNIERAFCSNCGSMVPDLSEDGETVYVPAGSHEESFDVDSHIFVASKAPWFEITDNLPQHDEYPSQDNQQSYPDKPLPEKTEGVVRGSCLCNAIKV